MTRTAATREIQVDDPIETAPGIGPHPQEKPCDKELSRRLSIVANTDIHETSSYGIHSKPVIAMAECHKAGRPIALYELMQGMVDFGKNHNPPPRIHFILKEEGQKITYDGTNVPTDAQSVEAIEFENYGQGLTPEDTVIDMHGEDEGEDTLGDHGHGTTIALTYLESMGIHTQIASNCMGRTWKGTTGLEDTPTGKTKRLIMDGVWGKNCDPAEQKTVFRINHPTPQLVSDFQKIPDLFLPANPKYPGAIIVPVNQAAISYTQVPHKIGQGEVRCLEGVVPHREHYDFIYVDGLQVTLGRQSSILPWQISGLKNAKDPYRIARSKDSTTVDGYLREVIPVIVNQLTDKATLKKIIQTAIKEPNKQYIELEQAFYSRGMSEPTKALVCTIWAEEYGDTLIDNDIERVNRAKTELPDEKHMHVSTNLFHFLTSAGVTTILERRGAKGTEMKYLDNLRVSSPDKPEALDKLMANVAINGGDVSIVKIGGKRHLRLKLPHAVISEDEFKGASEHNLGKLIRLVAIVAHCQNIELQAFSMDGTSHTQIHTKVGQAYEQDCYSAKVTTEQYPIGNFPQFLSYDIDSTYLLLSGDRINTLEQPDRLDLLVAEFKAILEKVKKALSEVKVRMAGAKTASENPEPTPDIVKTTIDETPANDADISSTNREIEHESRVSPGNYPLEVGSRLSFSTDALSWTSECQWYQVEVPRKGPRRNNLKIVEKAIAGSKRLAIRSGHEITSYETGPKDANVEFFRDAKNGLYLVVGDVENLEVFTAEDKGKNHSKRKPTAEEAENPLISSSKLLQQHWRELIDTIEANEQLSNTGKATLVAQAWNDRFSHRSMNKVPGESRSKCALQLVNGCGGEDVNYATGLAILLRTVGVPSKVVKGYIVTPEFTYSRATWVEYFDGTRWTALASSKGTQYKKEDLPTIVNDEPKEDTNPRIVDDKKPRYRERNSKKNTHGIRRGIKLAILASLLGIVGTSAYYNVVTGSENDDRSTTPAITRKPKRSPSPTPEDVGISIGRDICQFICK